MCVCVYWAIGLLSRVFANCPGDWGSIPDQVIPKTQKLVLDATLLNTQHLCCTPYRMNSPSSINTRQWSIDRGSPKLIQPMRHNHM